MLTAQAIHRVLKLQPERLLRIQGTGKWSSPKRSVFAPQTMIHNHTFVVNHTEVDAGTLSLDIVHEEAPDLGDSRCKAAPALNKRMPGIAQRIT